MTIPPPSRFAAIEGAHVRRVVVTMVCGLAVWTQAVVWPTPAWADDQVTYEVVSDEIHTANIEYQDMSGRVSAQQVPLPWRIDTTVRGVRSEPPQGSQVRADWRPAAAPTRWVSVRIIYHGKVICQNTLDIGDATCYGITPRIT